MSQLITTYPIGGDNKAEKAAFVPYKLSEKSYVGLYHPQTQQILVTPQDPTQHVDQQYFLPSIEQVATRYQTHYHHDLEDMMTHCMSFDQIRHFENDGIAYDGKRIRNHLCPVESIQSDGLPSDLVRVDYEKLFDDKEVFTREVFDRYLIDRQSHDTTG